VGDAVVNRHLLDLFSFGIQFTRTLKTSARMWRPSDRPQSRCSSGSAVGILGECGYLAYASFRLSGRSGVCVVLCIGKDWRLRVLDVSSLEQRCRGLWLRTSGDCELVLEMVGDVRDTVLGSDGADAMLVTRFEVLDYKLDVVHVDVNVY
jgi:hypothetical protein